MTRVMVLGGAGTGVPVAEAGIEVVPAAPGVGNVDAILVGHTRDFGAEALEAAAEAL